MITSRSLLSLVGAAVVGIGCASRSMSSPTSSEGRANGSHASCELPGPMNPFSPEAAEWRARANRARWECDRGSREACVLLSCWELEGRGRACEYNRSSDVCLEASAVFALAGEPLRSRSYCERACALGEEGACDLLQKRGSCY
jgi:hypothetical protein